MMRLQKIWAVASHLTFWGWNLAFLTLAYVGLLPFLVPEVLSDWALGVVPLDILVTVCGLIVLPTVATLVGFLRFRTQSGQLLRLFYGVEAPLMVLGILRLFLFRDLAWGVSLILVTAIIAILAFASDLLAGDRWRGSGQPLRDWIRLSANSLMMLAGLGMGLLLVFYSLPLAIGFGQGLIAGIESFFRFNWISDWPYFASNFLWLLLFWGLFLLSALVLMAMPFALVGFYLQTGWQLLHVWGGRYGRSLVYGSSGALMLLWLLWVGLGQVQPQNAAFALLNLPGDRNAWSEPPTPPSLPTNPESRRVQLAQSERIRQGLLNAYLSSYRYLSPVADNSHVRNLYHQLGFPDEWANTLQAANNLLLAPFLYEGSRFDSDLAAQLYAEFFDVSIQKGERQPILHAVQSTYNRDEAKAGVLNLDSKSVALLAQDLTVTPHADWAEIELHEVYDNQTAEQQEVFYAFSLPESAVLTGLWLGDTDNRAQRFPFVVAPRGAAQQVYNQEVQRRVDPALLEQVGPQQYRLRAFPVPPRTSTGTLTPIKPGRLHLWLTYTTLQQPGGWPLPQLIERRNLFWSDKTQRRFNGQRVSMPADPEVLSGWLPAYLKADQPFQATPHEFSLSNGSTQQRIQAKPVGMNDYRLPQGQHLALLLDSSFSMAAHQGELRENWLWLKNLVLPNNQVDVFIMQAGIGAQKMADPGEFSPQELTFYGSLSLRQMIEDFSPLASQSPYDAIVLLTDPGSYELSKDLPDLPVPPVPLWVIHMGGLPSAYDDPVLAAILDSGGGIGQGLQETLQRFNTEASLGDSVISVVDGYAWTKGEGTEGSGSAPSGLEAVAARQWIQALTQAQLRNPDPANRLANLDRIHAIAKQYSLVTPFSSMLVLVNDEQREALKKAEEQADRFDREVETGNETLTQPGNPLGDVSGVPEPGEWLLMGLVSLGVVGVWFFRRRGSVA